jgi:hypothetical protein
LYPCISDFYEPQVVDDTQFANTVIQDNKGQCEFIQLPPQINQDTRLNAHFVKRTADDDPPPVVSGTLAPWRPMTEWENPIWGWVVANHAESGIQLFLADGTFYREVRLGPSVRLCPTQSGCPSHQTRTSRRPRANWTG